MCLQTLISQLPRSLFVGLRLRCSSDALCMCNERREGKAKRRSIRRQTDTHPCRHTNTTQRNTIDREHRGNTMQVGGRDDHTRARPLLPPSPSAAIVALPFQICGSFIWILLHCLSALITVPFPSTLLHHLHRIPAARLVLNCALPLSRAAPFLVLLSRLLSSPLASLPLCRPASSVSVSCMITQKR